MPFDSKPLSNRVVITSDLRAAREIQERILDQASALGYTERCLFAIRMGMEEAMVNAHRHGNRGDSAKHITVSYDISPKRVVVRVADEGGGFDPNVLPDPTSCERITLPHGRGVMLMRCFLDEVAYNDRGNEVQIIKTRA